MYRLNGGMRFVRGGPTLVDEGREDPNTTAGR